MELRPGTPAQVGLRPDRIDHARRLAARWVEEGVSPSIIVLVARRGRIVLHEAFGVLGPGADSPPLRSDSIFAVMSITKTMTATALMMLVEDGIVGLNRPLVEYIPEVCGEGTDQLCVHHLLTHTSGYNEDELAERLAKEIEHYQRRPLEPTQDASGQRTLDIHYGAPLWKLPGEEMSYCHHNYRLLGEIVRRMSGQSLSDFMRERLFAPLGMSDTSLVVPEEFSPRIVRFPAESALARLTRDSSLGEINSRRMEEAAHPAASAYSTVRDLAIFGQTFLNRGRYGDSRILGPQTVEAMTRNHIPGIGTQFGSEYIKEASWGLGWIVQSNEKWKYFTAPLFPIGAYFHSGFGTCCLAVVPDEELVIASFEVSMEMTPDYEAINNIELFQSIVMSAIDD